MKLSIPLFLSALVFFSCKPHDKLDTLKSELKKEVKGDKIEYQTDFEQADNAKGKWKAGRETDTIENGSYSIKIDSIRKYVEVKSPLPAIDYFYSITAKAKLIVRDTTGIAYIGLTFDRVDTNYYKILCISNTGKFYVNTIFNGEKMELIPLSSSRFLHKGSDVYNTIEIRHHHKNFEILFNGSLASICKIPSLRSYGRPGLIAGATDGKQHYTAGVGVFDNFILKRIKVD